MAFEVADNTPQESPIARDGSSLAGSPVATRVKSSDPELLPGEYIRVHPITGAKMIEGGVRRSAFKPLPKVPVRIKYPVEGLSGFESDLAFNFSWVRPEPIDEADARDAQCRAGYPDTGYGFFGLNVTTTPEGLFRATWCSWKSSE